MECIEECRNCLSTYVPPSTTNRNSLVPFVFSSEASRTDDIFTKLFSQKNDSNSQKQLSYENSENSRSDYFFKSPRYFWSDYEQGHRVTITYWFDRDIHVLVHNEIHHFKAVSIKLSAHQKSSNKIDVAEFGPYLFLKIQIAMGSMTHKSVSQNQRKSFLRDVVMHILAK